MKLQELYLAAFGPFTDKAIVFDQAAGGLYIVYGPNEAGKSSALRGLKALLYGIEERTLDNFLHDNSKLRINGRLCNTDGHELVFTRRKGRKHTLLTLAGEELDAQALAPFLQGVTLELFETLFGIDHQALVQGGQEILEQKGEVGQALFSAALGSHALHAVLEELDDEADGLFRPRGSTQKINSALKAYSKLQGEIRETSLSSRQWDEQRRALARTTKDLQQIQSALTESRTELNRLKRIQRVLPKLARRRELWQEWASMGDVVLLAEDFTQRRRQAVQELETAKVLASKATPRLHGFKKQLEELSIRQGLLDQAENIEALHARLGSYRKAQQERPHLVAERQQLLNDADALLKAVRPDLGLDELEKLRPILARRQGIVELGNKQAVLITRLEQTRSSQRETERRLKATHKERHDLPAAVSSAALRRAIVAARKLGDVDVSIQSDGSELVGLQAQCTADLSRLTLGEGALAELPGLQLPSHATIQRFEVDYVELEKRLQRLQEKREAAADVREEAGFRLDEIQRVSAVPTEADLLKARSGRDRVWQLLRRQWIEGEDISAEASQVVAEAAIPDVFEDRLVGADELADRMRREANRVHEVASLQARQVAKQQQILQLDRELEACVVEQNRLDTDWEALWARCQIQPRTPPEMRVWLNELERLRERAGQLEQLRQRVADQQETRQTHIAMLNQQLMALGKVATQTAALEPLLLECEDFAQQLDKIKQQRDGLEREIKTLEADLNSANDEQRLAEAVHEAWKAKWYELLERFGLQDDSSPAEMVDLMERLRELFAKQGEAEKLQIRISAIDADAESFHAQVVTEVTSIAAELAGLPVDNAVMQLNSLLAENRTRETNRRHIKEQLEQAQQEIQVANVTIQSMSDRLAVLCEEAKCGKSELEEAERRSAEYLRIKQAIELIEQAILETGEGATLAELVAEAEGIDPDVLPASIEALSHRIEAEFEPKRTLLAEAKGRQEKELELMDGSDKAAALADQAQAVLARMRSDADRYVRVKLASRVLRDQIERYRQANQGPLVKRASEHFASLTLESFVGLMTDFNDKDEPVLAGIRPAGEKVHVAGMSSGTRDQLYLALRLASLEKYMESAEPMPFIVDDVLVDFDDKRSEAALSVLAELALTTQVILFTHHSQVVEQVKRLPDTAHVQVHEL